MPSLTVIDRAGVERVIDAPIGSSVMEVIRSAGIDELLAMCGGCTSCATCHVYIEAEPGLFPAMSCDENDLLDGSDHRTSHSRLSCQLPVGSASDGLRITIAPED